MKKLMIVMVCAAFVVGCKKKATPKKKVAAAPKTQTAKRTVPAKSAVAKPVLVLAGATLKKGTKVSTNTLCKVHLAVSGMTCQYGCAPQVRTALKGVKGISTALVSFKTKSATVDGKGHVCGGLKTQGLINKAFAKKQYKCTVSKIEIFAQKKTAKKKS